MAIKKINADMLDKIATNTLKEKQTEQVENSALSETDLETLHDAGMSEISEVMLAVGVSLSMLKGSSFAPIFMNSDVVQDFAGYMVFFCEEMIPKLLKGDIDGIMDLTTEGALITPERLKEMREQVYELLQEKYL